MLSDIIFGLQGSLGRNRPFEKVSGTLLEDDDLPYGQQICLAGLPCSVGREETFIGSLFALNPSGHSRKCASVLVLNGIYI